MKSRSLCSSDQLRSHDYFFLELRLQMCLENLAPYLPACEQICSVREDDLMVGTSVSVTNLKSHLNIAF